MIWHSKSLTMDGWVSERLSTRDDSAVSFATLLPSVRPLSSSLFSLPDAKTIEICSGAQAGRQAGRHHLVTHKKKRWTELLDRLVLSWIMNYIFGFNHCGIILILRITWKNYLASGGSHIEVFLSLWGCWRDTIGQEGNVFSLSCHLEMPF